jgi:hypothetical protein
MIRPLERAIEDVRARARKMGASRGLLWGAAALAGGALVLFALDNVLHLGTAARVLLDLLLLGALGCVAVKTLVLPPLRPVPREESALLIERTFPGLDNRLINALRLEREGTAPPMVLGLISFEAASSLERTDLREVLPRRLLRRAALAAGAAALLLAAYALLLPDYFSNALKRYALPAAFTPPITRTTLRVSPGDRTVVEGETVTVKAEVGGEIPPGARIAVGKTSYDMRFMGGHFAFDFRNVEAPFEYSVRAGDAVSDTFRITVTRRARIERLCVEYTYPDYLKKAPHKEDPASGHIAAVEGTRIALSFRITKQLKRVQLAATPPIEAARTGDKWEFEVTRSGNYRFDWTDWDGLEGKSPTYTLAALKDNPPTVRLLEPSRALSVRPDTELTAVVQAADDFGLASVVLACSRAENERAPIADIKVADREVRASHRLRVKDLGVEAGRSVTVYAVARDLKGQETSSNTAVLRLLDEAQAREELAKELAGIVARLRQIIAWQKRTRELTLQPKPSVEVLVKDQQGIHRALAEIHGGWTTPDLRHLAARTRLDKVIRGPAARAVEEVRSDRPSAAATQAAIVAELEAIVAELEGLLTQIKQGDLAKALQDAADKTPRQEARDLLAGLKDFMAEQKKVIQDSMDLKMKAPEDFSAEDKKKLETLRQTEEQWGKFLQEKATDLSKVPPQDFSSASLAKELNEAFSEVKMAADALAKKAVELAIPHEESGLELAKEITENIERWLADAPDNQKWNMEEPMKDADVPMADLPEELEDLIGDLIDKEDELAEESQDVTSSWMDSMNKGAGWGAADGPISNMSAKGVTGNLQPNSQEVGGRSGEGRSGKSSGQFVEESASGKGGKQTPTRSTPDPYEAGRVKDKSKDPSGGSTGGGKAGSGNKEGLRGVPPQQIQQKMDRLADQQADIRNVAEKAKVAMQKRGYVSEDLAAAIKKMKELEDQMRRHQGADYPAEAKAVAERLDAAKKTLQDQLELLRDPTAAVTRERRDELMNALDEDIPAEFGDWVREYYRSLSGR